MPIDTRAPLLAAPEHEDLRRALRRFLTSAASVTRARAHAEGEEFDRAVWLRLADELGVTGLGIPEEFGGVGFGLTEQAVVLEELGRELYGGPYLASVVLGAAALLAAGDRAAQEKLLPGIAAGETVATLAAAGVDGEWRVGGPTGVVAREREGGWVLDGSCTHVPDATVADVLLVLADTEQGRGLFVLPAGSPGLSVADLSALDQTRRFSRVELRGAAAECAGTPGDGDRVLAAVLDRAAVALGAEQLGGAARCLELAVEYAKVRHQFGEPIGRFQAIKHLCADMYLAVESSRSAVMFASRALDEETAEAGAAASLTKAWCSDAFLQCAGDAMQIHGGIGYTWECDVQLYFKRAQSSKHLFGGPAHHRDTLAARLGL